MGYSTTVSAILTLAYQWFPSTCPITALRRSVAWSLLAVTVCASIYVRAQSQGAKLSTFDLRSYGWQPLPKRHSGQGGEWPGISSPQLSTDHKGRVLVGFTAHENYGLATRERPGLSFHLLRFTPEGKIDLSLVLPTKDYFTNGFYLGANDQILAAQTAHSKCFRREMKPVKGARFGERWAPVRKIATSSNRSVAAR
jgi:hypothetical protein